MKHCTREKDCYHHDHYLENKSVLAQTAYQAERKPAEGAKQ